MLLQDWLTHKISDRLAIGPAWISEKKSKARNHKEWVKETRDFIRYLCVIADWRMTIKILTGIREEKGLLKFFNDDKESQKLVDATANYYETGILPDGLLPEPEALMPWVGSNK